MVKRSAVAILWFAAGWIAGSIVSFALGLPWWITLTVAGLAAINVALDPLHLIWRPDEETTVRSKSPERMRPSGSAL